MFDNPWDPRRRDDLTENERVVMHFTNNCLHGDDMSLVDRYVSEDYTQHTPGIGQGRDGLRAYLREVAWKRPGRREWRPIHLFAAGDFVILHKLLTAVVIADFFRFDDKGMLAEHWDVVQPLPEPDYDPLRPSSENLDRFRALFGISD
ncbi:MAG TPA: nuclear transport factor 2 family protein [Ilumatobacteraceae bacterium]